MAVRDDLNVEESIQYFDDAFKPGADGEFDRFVGRFSYPAREKGEDEGDYNDRCLEFDLAVRESIQQEIANRELSCSEIRLSEFGVGTIHVYDLLPTAEEVDGVLVVNERPYRRVTESDDDGQCVRAYDGEQIIHLVAL